MTCGSCAAAIESHLNGQVFIVQSCLFNSLKFYDVLRCCAVQNGVHRARVNLLQEVARVDYDPDQVDENW